MGTSYRRMGLDYGQVNLLSPETAGRRRRLQPLSLGPLAETLHQPVLVPEADNCKLVAAALVDWGLGEAGAVAWRAGVVPLQRGWLLLPESFRRVAECFGLHSSPPAVF